MEDEDACGGRTCHGAESIHWSLRVRGGLLGGRQAGRNGIPHLPGEDPCGRTGVGRVRRCDDGGALAPAQALELVRLASKLVAWLRGAA